MPTAPPARESWPKHNTDPRQAGSDRGPPEYGGGAASALALPDEPRANLPLWPRQQRKRAARDAETALTVLEAEPVAEQIRAEAPQKRPERAAHHVGCQEPQPGHAHAARDDAVELPQPRPQIGQKRRSAGRAGGTVPPIGPAAPGWLDDPAVTGQQRPAAEATDGVAGAVAEHGRRPHHRDQRHDPKTRRLPPTATRRPARSPRAPARRAIPDR